MDSRHEFINEKNWDITIFCDIQIYIFIKYENICLHEDPYTLVHNIYDFREYLA